MATKTSHILDLKILGTDKLVNLEKEINKYEASMKKMDKTDKKHTKTIAEQKVQLKNLRSERNTEQKGLIASHQATKKLDGSYNGLVARNKAILTSLKQNKKGMKGNTAEVKKMKAEYTKNNAKLKEFDSSLGNNQRNVGNYKSGLAGARDSLAKTGMAVGAAIIAFQAIGRVVTMLTADFGEFEKSFTNVLTLMSAGDIEQFHGEMQKGALDIISKYGFAINDVNKALFDSVSAGVPAAESVEFMNVAANLALGGVTDLSTSVDGMTTIMNSFQLETSEANKIANAFFTAQKYGKTTVEELSVAIGQVAPHAKRAGMSYQELLAAMAELTKQGIKTDLAATALKSTITAIEKPSEKAKAVFDKMGISYGTNAIKSQGLMTILTKITAAGEDNADVLTELIPNIRALTGVSAMGAAQLEDYHVILGEVNDDYGDTSSLSKAVAMQQETLEQQMARLNGEWTVQKILLGEELKPAMDKIIKAMGWIVEHAVDIARWTKAGVIAFIAYKVAMIGATIVTNLQTGAITRQIIKQKLLNLTMKMNPWGLVIAGVTAAITLFSDYGDEVEVVSQREKERATHNEKVATALNEVNTAHEQQIVQVKKLNKLVMNQNLAEGDRQKALDEFNQKFGTTVKYTNDYIKLQQRMGTAVDDVTNKLKAQLVLKIAETEIEELLIREIALDEKLAKQKGEVAIQQNRLNELNKTGSRETKQSIENSKNSIKMLNENGEVIEQVAESVNEKGRREYQASISAEVLADMNRDLANTETDLRIVVNKQNTVRNKATADIAKYGGIVDEIIKKISSGGGLKAKILSLADAMLLETNTIEKLGTKRTELIKIVNTAVIGSDLYVKAKKEVIKIDKEIELTKDKEVKVIETSVESLTKEIAANKTYLEMLEGKTEAINEYNNSHIKQLEMKIRLIYAQATADQKLTDQQLVNLGVLEGQLKKFQASLEDPEDKKSPLEKAMWGEGVQDSFAMANSALDMLSMSMSGNAQLAKVEFDNEMHNLNTAKNTELENFDKSKAAEKMSNEQRATAREKIQTKHDGKILTLKKTEFERNKELETSEAKMAGAMAIMRIWSGQITSNPVIDAIIKLGLIGVQIGRTNKQIKAIKQTEFKGAKGGIIPTFADGGMVHGNSHAQGGVKFNVGGTVAELEGGEAVINKRSTEMFRNELSNMNAMGGGKRFADGGLVLGALAKAEKRSLLTEEDINGIANALSHQRVTVTESDITGTQNTVSILESRATF